MKNIFSKIFKKNNNKESEKNSLIFSINRDGDLLIEVVLKENNKNSHEYLGNLLFELNNGNYTQNILDLLLEISKNNPNFAQLVKKTISVWSAKVLLHTPTVNEDAPIINPSQFYNGKNYE
jgi:hypothetical protein